MRPAIRVYAAGYPSLCGRIYWPETRHKRGRGGDAGLDGPAAGPCGRLQLLRRRWACLVIGGVPAVYSGQHIQSPVIDGVHWACLVIGGVQAGQDEPESLRQGTPAYINRRDQTARCGSVTPARARVLELRCSSWRGVDT